MLIAIDAGHGGKDPGALANGLKEKEITLTLALKIGTYLRNNYHCEVMYTRNKDVFLSLSERANIANRSKADFFCSIHINSFNATANGFETYRYPGTAGKTLALQKTVHEEIMKVLKPYNIMDRGMKQQDFAVVRQTTMPALLTETLFLSNPNEAKLLKSDVFLDKVAIAHAKGLAKSAGVKSKSKATPASKKHCLMTGTFNSKEEAEKQAKMLRDRYGWLIYVKEA